jgi:capsular exopolysaccharide synthesis family protein
LEPVTNPTQASAAGDEELLSIDIGRYLTAVRKYKWVILAIVAVSITGAVFYTSRQTKIYQATASVQIEPRLPDVLGQGQDIIALGAGNVSATLEYYKSQLEILGSRQLIEQTVQANDLHLRMLTASEREGRTLDQAHDLATLRLKEMVKVSYPVQNRVMYVAVQSRDPQLAADIANFHIATYERYAKGLLSTDTQRASKYLAAEFDNADKSLRAVEAELLKFQKENDIIAVSLADRQNQITANITSFSLKLNDVRARRLELAAKLDRMKKLSQVDVLESPVLSLSTSVSLDELKSQFYLERNKFIELDKEVGPKNAEWVKQKVKTDDLYGVLRNEAKIAVGSVEEQHAMALATERALALEVDRYTKEAFDLAPKILEYSQLMRTKKGEEDKYNILVGRLSTSEMTSRIDTINVKPLDPAQVPTDPVSPDLRVNVMAAGMISLFVGIGLALLLAFLDRSVKSVEDAQTAAASPVLGVIPMIAESDLPRDDDKARDLYVFEHPTSRVAECCRSLRTNILFSGADRPLKTLVVSSPNPREGKTTTVIYLGTTMAQSGQRVLLVDTDMRRPRLHASTGVPRQKGLSNLIVGEDRYEDVIKQTEIPNLFVLPCGPLPPNPAELLMTKRFATVLKELAERFDRVILDSPPLGAVTDAVVLSKQADGVMLVVRSGKTLRDEVTRSVKSIRSVNGTIVGVILNEIALEDRRGYYSYYGYGQEAEQPG